MQSSHARWERLPQPHSRTATKLMNGMSTLRLTSEERTPPSSSSSPSLPANANEAVDDKDETIFAAIPSALTRRFAISDTYYESPQYSNMGLPGPDGDVQDIGGNGLISAANPMYPEFMSPEILAELPPECKDALAQAATAEWEWKTKWHRETVDGNRTYPLKSYAWFP